MSLKFFKFKINKKIKIDLFQFQFVLYYKFITNIQMYN